MTYQDYILARLLDFSGEKDFVHDGIYLTKTACEYTTMNQKSRVSHLVKGKDEVEFAHVLEEGICIKHELVRGKPLPEHFSKQHT